MRYSVVKATLVIGLMALSARAAEYSLVPVGTTTISPGDTITIEVFVNGVLLPDRLRSYQATLAIVPGAGAAGSVELVDPVTPDPGNTSIFVDTGRIDWVFASVPGTVFAPANPGKRQLGATIFDPAQSVEVSSPKYCGTFILTPAVGTVGDFQLKLLLVDPTNPSVAPTFLGRPDNSFVPFTDVGLTVTVVPTPVEPPNNLCANAAPLPAGITGFTTVNATTDGPALPAACDEGTGISLEQDVWYEHTAACTGVLTISTCNDADFDTRLAVYGSGLTSCACPADNTTLIDCSDNAAGCTAGTSEVALSVIEGECLTVRVGGVGIGEGTGNLTVTCAPDLCPNAQPITVGSSVDGSTKNTAVNDAIGPDCGAGPVNSPGVWYSVTGTGNLMTASLTGAAGFDTRLTVYEGACGALSCVADADNVGSGLESVSWCSTVGTVYSILVHASGGQTGAFTLTTADGTCDDGNLCTNDTCSAGACVNTANFDATSFCCAPSTGNLAPLDDANPCTNDSCNASTGVVTHAPVPDQLSAACDDRDPCTVDACQGGLCANTDINTLTCSVDTDCGNLNTCGADGFCRCVAATLELVADPGASTISGCYAAGEVFTVRLELGPQDAAVVSPTPITGVQAFLEYDPASLDFLSIQPGKTADPTSPFSFEITESVDPVLGTIDYLVGVALGGAAPVTPETAAVITFQAVAECDAFVRFRPSGPNGASNLLATLGGGKLNPALIDLAPVKVNLNSPVLSACPADIVVPPDPGLFTSVVTWTAPTATDSCDVGPVAVSCSPPSGSVFNVGTTPVTCVATDSCGFQDQCTFNVIVDAPVVTADLAFSASVSPAPFLRCITFDLWDCTGPPGAQHATVQQSVLFTNGVANGVQVEVPGGQWKCMTARDELHSLRSQASNFATLDGINYTASFTGSRATGGHWLVGGNLNNDDFIDILDFGVFFAQFLTVANPDTPCGTVAPDSNVNGDNVVDALDLIFLAGPNSLQASEPACCAVGAAAAATAGPVTSITVEELRARGLGYLAPADINGDGVLDDQDILALINGDGTSGTDPRSLRPRHAPKRTRARRPGR